MSDNPRAELIDLTSEYWDEVSSIQITEIHGLPDLVVETYRVQKLAQQISLLNGCANAYSKELSAAEMECLNQIKLRHEELVAESEMWVLEGGDYRWESVSRFKKETNELCVKAIRNLKAGLNCSAFSTIEIDEIIVPVSDEVKTVISVCWNEAVSGYGSHNYVSAIMMCGKILEAVIKAIAEESAENGMLNLKTTTRCSQCGQEKKRDKSTSELLEDLKGRVPKTLRRDYVFIRQVRNDVTHEVQVLVNRDRCNAILLLTKNLLCDNQPDVG